MRKDRRKGQARSKRREERKEGKEEVVKFINEIKPLKSIGVVV